MTDALSAVQPLRLGLVLVYTALALLGLWRLRLPVAREAVGAALRAAAQLAMVGSVLLLVFQVDRLEVSSAVLAVMVTVAAFTAAARVRGRMALRFCLGVIATTSLAVIVPMAVSGVFDLTASFLVPISGMVIGNAMNSTALAVERLESELRSRRDQVEAYLSLGIDPDTSLRQVTGATVTASLIPSLNSLKTTGIVHIPGMMTGMLLAGQNPLWAAQMQLTILYLIFAAALMSSVLVSCLGRTLYFTELEALALPEEPAEP